MTRIRIAAAALALAVALVSAFAVMRALRDSPSGTPKAEAVPHWLAYHRLILAQVAEYEHDHSGVSCTTDPPDNVYANQIMCKRPGGRAFGLAVIVANQP